MIGWVLGVTVVAIAAEGLTASETIIVLIIFIVIACISVATPLFYLSPEATLGAIVVVAISGMVKVAKLKHRLSARLHSPLSQKGSTGRSSKLKREFGGVFSVVDLGGITAQINYQYPSLTWGRFVFGFRGHRIATVGTMAPVILQWTPAI